MGNANSGVSGVNTLTTVTTRTIDVDTEVFLLYFEIFFGSFGQDCNCGSGGVDTALGFGDWDTLDAVDPTFEFELAVGIIARYFKNNFFYTTGFVFVFGD